VGTEFEKAIFFIFYIYGKKLPLGIENQAFKNIPPKIFLHIAEKVPCGRRK